MCVDCGSAVERQLPARRWPLRCPECKRTRERKKNRAARLSAWESCRCVDCGDSIAEAVRRGPIPRRCEACKRAAERSRKAARRGCGKSLVHAITCHHCQREFRSDRKRQKFCSPECSHASSRNRQAISCQHCGVSHEVAAGRSCGRRFCSRECWAASRRSPARICAGCGCEFFRCVNGKRDYQDKGKYCTRECYLNHRWGSSRPRKRWSRNHVDRCSQRALATSLRQRCKHFGVPFDPACTREAVCDRDGWVCQQCGVKCHKGRWRINNRTRKASARNAEHDHIVPLGCGIADRGNTFDNSQCLCRRCNGRKGKRRGSQLRIRFTEPV